MKILTLTNVTKKYNDKILFENLNLSFEKGKIYAIVGKSGSGKSTLLNIIGGIEKPTFGSTEIFGISNLASKRFLLKKILRYNISFLFQNYGLSDNDTVEANLKMALVYNKKVGNKKVAIKEALDKVGLAGMEKVKIYLLSGGEQQRVAIARLLLKPTEVILADEPTGNVDMENRDVIFALLNDFKNEGKTVIIVTHDKDLANNCDEIFSL